MRKIIKSFALILSGALLAGAVFILIDHVNDRKIDLNAPLLTVMAAESAETPANKDLLDDAYSVLTAIRDRNYSALAGWIHPELGVLFTPYSTVEPDVNLHFSAEVVKGFETSEDTYVWGTVDGVGSPITMTPSAYFDRYVYDAEYAEAPVIGINTVVRTGNSLENVKDVFPDAEFVEFHFPGSEEHSYIDWKSLKLVFSDTERGRKLIAIIHSEWTI
ncbi:MAG: hypothetical protein GX193_00215 [Clostridiales bacterium]|nr:hypothetical protein [Clostridiales bacterium]